MSTEFDPSPRASKRRRTRYGSQRTFLADDATNEGTLDDQPTSHNDKTGTVSECATSPTTQDTHADKHSLQRRTQTASRTPAAKPKARTGAESKSSSKDAGGAGDAEDSDTPETPSRTARKGRTTSSRKSLTDARSTDTRVNGDGVSDKDEQAGNSKRRSDEDETPQPRSSGRQRRPPRRLEDTLGESAKPAGTKRPKTSAVQPGPDESAPASPALKGILTPSKKQRTGPRKSVMFNHDEKEIEEQLGFRDIDTPAKPLSKSTTRKATPYPRRSKRIDEIEEEPEPLILENELEPNVDDNVSDDMPVDELIMDISLPNASAKDHALASSTTFLEDDPHLQEVKSMVLARLTTTSLPLKPPSHLEKQHAQLHSLLRSTVTASESNSLLLLGPRGAGKSMLLNLALRDLESAHPNDFHVVHLNGFLQTDDRLALREIWRQLGHSRDLDETETEDIGASYADTMASLLSLLSHPDEMAVDPVANADIEALAQEASVIAGGGQKTSKSIVFILDEFDLFTTHPRQTLLYNLFDIAQSRKAPIAVIGCSTRMDVIECLEKRVKSRFSHRWLLVPGVKNIAEWNTSVEDALLLDASDEAQAKRSKNEEGWVQRWNSEMKVSQRIHLYHNSILSSSLENVPAVQRNPKPNPNTLLHH